MGRIVLGMCGACEIGHLTKYYLFSWQNILPIKGSTLGEDDANNALRGRLLMEQAPSGVVVDREVIDYEGMGDVIIT